MAEERTIDVNTTAVLIMDFQNDIVNSVAQDPPGVVQKAAQVLDLARHRNIPIIHIVHKAGRFAEPSPGGEIHTGVTPAPGEKVISKTRAGPFSTTGLDVLLREMGIVTLVMMGVATSGCVLSSVRWAVDVDYKFVVVSDACSDADPEVHRVLTEKVYPRQGTVMTTQEFLQAI